MRDAVGEVYVLDQQALAPYVTGGAGINQREFRVRVTTADFSPS